MDKDGALNDASFIGIGRRGDSYFIAHVKYGKVIDVKGNFTEKEVVSDSEFRARCGCLSCRLLIKLFSEKFMRGCQEGVV